MLWLWFLSKMWVPRRVRTQGSFHAADPWNSNRLATFTIEVYKMVHRSVKVVRDSAMSGPPKFGIKSEIDGQDRMLPEFLQTLWQEKEVSSEALPELLHSIEPELKKNDFHVYGRGRQRLIEVMVGLYTLAALGLLGVSLKSYWGVHQAAAVHELEPVALALNEWQAAPWKNDNVAVKGMAAADPVVAVPSGITVPPDAEGFPTSDYSVALTKSAPGHVMILLPRNLVNAGNSYSLTGIVQPAAALGLPATFLAGLKEHAPDLDTDHVLCLYWRWKGAGYGGNPFIGAYIGFAMAAFVGGLAAMMALIFFPKFARRRRHTAWALRQITLAHA